MPLQSPPEVPGTSSTDSDKTVRQSSSFLKPPATIISPPSPTDLKSSHPDVFPPAPTPSETEHQSIQYDSPDEHDSDIDSQPKPKSPRRPSSSSIPQRPRGPSDSLGPIPVTNNNLSASPSTDTRLLHPDSPSALSTSPRPSPSRLTSSSITVTSPRSYSRSSSPTPSSPRPRREGTAVGEPGMGHRRMSSTHRVRETTDGEQKNTETGERMVNQYRIGSSLGKGAYAKVELGVDVGTGTEYAIKEFSKSRLHHQALLQKHQQTVRIRNRRSRPSQGGSPFPPDDVGKRKAGEEPGGIREKSGDDGLGKEKGTGGPWKEGQMTGEDDPLGLIRREIAVMKKLDHPNIVLLYEAISVPNTDSLFLVLEYMPGGTLMNIQAGQEPDKATNPFEVDQAREYFRQLCLGLEYLHANEVVHRDIKPDNVLLSADRTVVKLCDFGVSEMFMTSGDDRIKKSGGSPAFLSPESFTAHTMDVHGKAVDIWALGVTLYCMLAGKLPFNVDNPIDLFDVVISKDPPIPDDWDDNLKNLIRKMLEKDPKVRINMSEIREHPWVTQHGEEPMIEVEENLYELGKHVEEPTVEELGNAIGSLRGVFTVIRAVQKMRRLQLHRRSASSQSASNQPSSPSSVDHSSSQQSGSMDSYNSNPSGSTATDETSDAGDNGRGKYGDLVGDEVGSPGSYSDAGRTERERGESNPFDKLKPIRTDLGCLGAGGKGKGKVGDEGNEEVLVDSPESDEDLEKGKLEGGQEKGGSVLVESPTSDGDGERQQTPVAQSGRTGSETP